MATRKGAPVASNDQVDIFRRVDEFRRASQNDPNATLSHSMASLAADMVETHLISVGPVQSGKTTLIFKLLDRDEETSTTAALEYTFGRRKDKLTDVLKALSHVWELGGGLRLKELLEFPLKNRNSAVTTAMIVVDASRPGDVIEEFSVFSDLMEAKAASAIGNGKKGAFVLDEDAQIWENHKDRNMVRRLPSINTVVVVAKFDTFLSNYADFEHRDTFCKALRFLAHSNQYSLCFSDANTSLKTFKLHMGRFIFNSGVPAAKPQFDINKTGWIQRGTDSYEDIFSSSAPSYDSQLARFKAQFAQLFGAPSQITMSQIAQPAGNSKDSSPLDLAEESQIDILRSQKDEELKRYRDEARAKFKAASAAAAGGGK